MLLYHQREGTNKCAIKIALPCQLFNVKVQGSTFMSHLLPIQSIQRSLWWAAPLHMEQNGVHPCNMLYCLLEMVLETQLEHVDTPSEYLSFFIILYYPLTHYHSAMVGNGLQSLIFLFAPLILSFLLAIHWQWPGQFGGILLQLLLCSCPFSPNTLLCTL